TSSNDIAHASVNKRHVHASNDCFHELNAPCWKQCEAIQMLAPRALIGHSASTRPFRTPTYQSCRLTVGSQCPGMSHSFSPSDKGFACGPTLSLPCSSETPVTSTPGRSCTHGAPRSAL